MSASCMFCVTHGQQSRMGVERTHPPQILLGGTMELISLSHPPLL